MISFRNFYLAAAVIASVSLDAQNTFPSSGSVGIGTAAPAALLNVKNGTILFDGTSGNIPLSGAGTRFMWIPSKAAFRAGMVNSTQWDATNIGNYSIAMGADVIAKGATSIALGGNCTANATILSVTYPSTAIGIYNTASGQYSTSMGSYSTASGLNTFAMGMNIVSSAQSSFVVGQNNAYGSYQGNGWIVTEPLFVIGNGVDINNRSNAFSVFKDGKTCIGNSLSASQKLQIDDGNALIRGVGNFGGTNNEAYLYLGDANHYIKSKYAYGVSIGTFGQPSLLSILESGKVTIGGPSLTSTPGTYKLYVTGGILTEKVRVSGYGTGSWADYVFADDYKLKSLGEVENFIQINKHLPEVPSASEVEKNGIDMAEMDATLLKKIEELTLYIIQQEKRISQLETELKKR